MLQSSDFFDKLTVDLAQAANCCQPVSPIWFGLYRRVDGFECVVVVGWGHWVGSGWETGGRGDGVTGRLGDWGTGRLGDWETGRLIYIVFPLPLTPYPLPLKRLKPEPTTPDEQETFGAELRSIAVTRLFRWLDVVAKTEQLRWDLGEDR